MKLFGQIVRTVVVAKDVVTAGGILTDAPRSATREALERLKDEASEDWDDDDDGFDW